MADSENVVMEGVRLIFRNFEGKEGPYNQEGSKNFGVILPEQTAQDMESDGWNVKRLKPREDEEADDEPMTPWLPVKVNYGAGRPPKIILVTDTKRTHLTEDTVGELDWVEIINVDLIVRPYHYDVRGSQGISAYLQSMYVTIEQDPLDKKYDAMFDKANQDPE